MCNVLAEKIKFETRQVIVLVSITFFPKSPGNMGIIALHASGIKRVKCPHTLRESGEFGQLAWMCLVNDKYGLSQVTAIIFRCRCSCL